MKTMKIKRQFCLCLLMILVSACSNNYGRYQQQHDSTPTRLPTASELHDATPRAEKPSRGGNKAYQVRGKHYPVLKSAENFSQTGIASWYGRKFHGHLTSNGEIYDMYAMSAAHKNLPLPTYLHVVNNSNGRSVIVRVNDRGPFHQSRIIDLSYSAAYKLDMLKTGTANVTITAITDFTTESFAIRPENSPNLIAVAPAADPENALIEKNINRPASSVSQHPLKEKGQYIQAFASKSNVQAAKFANTIAIQHKTNTEIEQKNGIFRVLVGPIQGSADLINLLLAIKDNGYPNAFIRK